jgi:hypothetical protein
MSDIFDPADPASWVGRGRSTADAEAIADAWQRYPDLPIDAPLDARMARTRERVRAMRPVHEAISIDVERQRTSRNFAFTARQLALDSSDLRNAAILRARDQHGHGWDEAVAYAAGWYAAHAGWEARPISHARDKAASQRAYDLGFREGGGRPDDIFDAARRRLAVERSPKVLDVPVRARPLPSQWPIPTDRPHPVSWARRLLVIGESEFTSGTLGILPLLRGETDHESATILAVARETGLRLVATPSARADDIDLRAHLAVADFGDVLVAADAGDLEALDALAHLLPFAKTMERTRNSVLQQRTQFRIWLARGRAPGEQFAGGHIRWGKVAPGLTGRLGDFTARYVGPAEPRGHRIVVEDANGKPATGYFTPTGAPLVPEVTISSKARMRQVMTEQLRQFAAALSLG